VIDGEEAAQDTPQNPHPINAASHGMTDFQPPPSVSNHIHAICAVLVLLSGRNSTPCQGFNMRITM